MKKLIVIGDRVLIKLDESEEKTKVGLYLPQTVKEKDEIARGVIVQTGPGIPLADPSTLGDEPWQKSTEGGSKHIAMESKAGDYCIFLRRAAVEINYEGERYFIAPQSAILLLVRDEESLDDLDLGESDLGFDK